MNSKLRRIATDKWVYISVVVGTVLAVGIQDASLLSGVRLGILTAVGYLGVDRMQAKRMTDDWLGQPEDMEQ